MQIDEYVHMANNLSLAGNAIIGDRSFLGSACTASSNIHLQSDSILGSCALLNKNFNEKFCTFAGVPAKIIKRNNFETKRSS